MSLSRAVFMRGARAPIVRDEGNGVGVADPVPPMFILAERDTSNSTGPDELCGKAVREAAPWARSDKAAISGSDPDDPVGKLLASVFGGEVIKRIVAGYAFVSRHYTPGDHVCLVGFGRGVYTARALAGLINSQGLLNPARFNLANKGVAHRLGSAAWRAYRAKATTNKGAAAKKGFFDLMHQLPRYARLPLRAEDLIPAPVTCVAVWESSSGVLALDNFDIHIYRNHRFSGAASHIAQSPSAASLPA